MPAGDLVRADQVPYVGLGETAETLWVPGIQNGVPAPTPGRSLWSRSSAEAGVWCCRVFWAGGPAGVPPPSYVKCPDGLVALMTAIDGGLSLAHDKRPLRGWILCGLQTRAVEFEVCGATQVLAVYLTPWAAYRLLSRPMHEFADRVVDLADVAPVLPHRLAARLAAGPRPGRAVAIAGRLITEVVRRGRPYADEVLEAWHTMHRRAGMVSIGAVAARAGLSERHLETRFREQIGLPPKRYARILRVQRACGLLAGGASVVETATACGYYDQAHLCREFKTFIGRSPSALSRSTLDLLPVGEDGRRAP